MAKNFLERQFNAQAPTPGQIAFDAVAGIILPLVCFSAERLFLWPGGVFGTYQLVAYAMSAIAMACLTLWLIRPISSGLLAGVFLSAGGFALITGVFLAPYTLIGLLMVIGVLGLVPFLSAFTYIRCGTRALRIAESGNKARPATATFVLGAVLFFALPGIPFLWLRSAADDALHQILHGSQTETAEAVDTLTRWRRFVDLDLVVWVYSEETDPRRRARLEQAYSQITGGERIEARLYELQD